MGPYTNNTVKHNKHNVSMHIVYGCTGLDSTVSISGYQIGFISN